MTGHAENQGWNGAVEETVFLPNVIPLFPLPRTVLLPGELLPLHVFEPRYREMVADALAGHRVVGLVAVQPGHEGEQAGNPPVEQVGCLGFIAQHTRFEDGRYLLWLIGLERFRIEQELEVQTQYRQARVEFLPSVDSAQELAGIQPLRSELRVVLPQILPSDEATRRSMREQLADVTDTQLVAIASQILELSSSRKQALLEAPSPVERYLMLYEDLYARMDQHPALDDLDPSQLN